MKGLRDLVRAVSILCCFTVFIVAVYNMVTKAFNFKYWFLSLATALLLLYCIAFIQLLTQKLRAALQTIGLFLTGGIYLVANVTVTGNSIVEASSFWLAAVAGLFGVSQLFQLQKS